MARKVVNRRELRDQATAAEANQASEKKTTKKAAGATGEEKPKRKSRAKTAKEVRLRAYWGVFNQSMKQVAKFEYSQRAEADKKAGELTASHRTPHFVQPVKEKIE